MIYYHFGSKAGLYREILRDMFGAVGARARTVAASDLPPTDKVRAFVDTFATEAQARPHFPPIWFREIAEGGAHLDDATLGDMTGVLKALASIVDEGVRAGEFRPSTPCSSTPASSGPSCCSSPPTASGAASSGRACAAPPRSTRDEVVAHVQRVALGLLEGRHG